MDDPVRVGVVGLGWVGTARHIPTLRADPCFRLIGVADRNGSKAASLSKCLSDVRAGSGNRLADIEWIEDVEAVSIATAPHSHCALVCEALERGLHVITEKPFAMSVAEGEAMVSTAKSADRVLAVVHNFQFARSMKALRADLDSGRIGRIRGIRAIQLGNPSRRLPEWYEELPLGLFYDESPHLLYLLASLAGPLSLIKAISAESRAGMTTPDQIDAWFEADGVGYPITLSCNFNSSLSEWHLVVHGDRAAGIVDIFRDIYLRLPEDGAHGTREVIRTSLTASWQHWLQHLQSGIPHLRGTLRYGNDEVIARFARAIRGEVDQLAPISADAAQRTLVLQHQIISMREKVYA